VVLNYRRDVDAWHKSASNTLARAQHHWPLFLLSCLDKECFWSWHLYVRFMWPGLFRAIDGNIETGIARCGKWAARGEYKANSPWLCWYLIACSTLQYGSWYGPQGATIGVERRRWMGASVRVSGQASS
jgi:hypothetical protein